MGLSLRLIWQEKAQLEVVSHESSREGTASVVSVLFCRVLYVYSHAFPPPKTPHDTDQILSPPN